MVFDSSISTLYQEAERLDNTALDTLIIQLQTIRTQRKTNDKQKAEADLLKKINRGLPISQSADFQSLNQKRLSYEISDTEMMRLQKLLFSLEKLHIERVKYIGQLAALRNVTVRELLSQLNLTPIING